MKPDIAQRKYLADFLGKFALALATAIAAKIFFSDEPGFTLTMLFAAIVMLLSFVLGYIIAHSTENKQPTQMHSDIKKGIFHIQNAEVNQ